MAIKRLTCLIKLIHKPLLKLSDVPAQAVGDAAYRGALNAGLSKGNAGIISTTIKESISWLF